MTITIGPREKAAILSALTISILYLGLSWLLLSGWQREMTAYLNGAAQGGDEAVANAMSFTKFPDFPFLLKPLMLPIPAAVGDGLFWAFFVQAAFIWAVVTAFILKPMWATYFAALFGLFVVLSLLSDKLAIASVATLFHGLPFLAILTIIAILIEKRLPER